MASLHLVLACALVTACGEPQASAPTSEGDSSTMPSTNPSKDPREDLTLVPSGKAGTRLTLRGTVSPGVETGCHLLTANGTTYLLIWNGGEIVDGQRVEVFGAVRPDAMTTCQQGVPFMVERLAVSDTP